MTESVTTIFNEIKTRQAALSFPVAKHYAPGLTRVQIDALLSAARLSLPEGLIELYSTVNGSTDGGDVPMYELWMFPGYYLLELSEAIAVENDLSTDPGWMPGWFPVFSSGGAVLYVCDANERILRSSPEEETPSTVVAEGVRPFLALIRDALREGRIFRDAAGVIDWDKRPWR